MSPAPLTLFVDRYCYRIAAPGAHASPPNPSQPFTIIRSFGSPGEYRGMLQDDEGAGGPEMQLVRSCTARSALDKSSDAIERDTHNLRAG